MILKKYTLKIIYYKGTIQIPLPCTRVSVIDTRESTEEDRDQKYKIILHN